MNLVNTLEEVRFLERARKATFIAPANAEADLNKEKNRLRRYENTMRNARFCSSRFKKLFLFPDL